MKRHALLLAAGLALLVSRAAAQHFLAVSEGGKLQLVVAARGTLPMIQEGGKLRLVNTNRFALGKGGQYLPCHVAVRHVEVKTSALLMNGLDEINKEFSLQADLETSYDLDYVFVVIVLHQNPGDSLFLYDVGELRAHDPKAIYVRVPTTVSNQAGRYQFYLFSRGRELFQTLMPIGEMEATLNRMVRERIKDVRDAPPQPFLGPTPEYPRALFRARVAGSATLAFTIGPNGAITDASVKEASQPEFGEAALAAIREWRFLPKVQDGIPVETKATMPFDFTPPKRK